MSFETLNLNENLIKALQALNYDKPTEIQQEAIPVALAGRDLMASAQTGTGKTAAFLLPVLERLFAPSAQKGRGPRALVLTPTRELASQVLESAKSYARFTRIRVGAIVGGASYITQERLLSQPLDLLIATPGRLMDHMDRKRVDFSRLEVLVLDEADRMLDMGFISAVEQIAAATPASRQTLLFSATLEGNVAKLAARMLRDPARIQISGVQEKHGNIEQRLHLADDLQHKLRLLQHLLGQDELTQAIVFTATKAAADQLASSLSNQGHATAALHGDMRQSQRNRTVQLMRRGEVKVLVATDVAARGLDIQGISHVINFDLPMVAEDYVHRIGRTGRAGASGIAISFTSSQDWQNLIRIERYTGQKLLRATVPGLEPKLSELHLSKRPPAGRNGGNRRSAQNAGGPNGGRPGQGQQRAKPGASPFESRSFAPKRGPKEYGAAAAPRSERNARSYGGRRSSYD